MPKDEILTLTGAVQRLSSTGFVKAAILSAGLANNGTTVVGNVTSRSSQMQKGDSMDLVEVYLNQVYVQGTAGDTLRLFGMGV